MPPEPTLEEQFEAWLRKEVHEAPSVVLDGFTWTQVHRFLPRTIEE